MNRLRLSGLFLIAAAAQAHAQPTPWGLPQLMQNLAEVKSASATFTERQTLAVLTTPLIDTGTLTYTAPDEIQKITTAPIPESFRLTGTQIAMAGPDQKTHVFSLDQDPRIGGLTAGIRATLAGDLPALSRLYTVRCSGAQAAWQLVLLPRDPTLAHVITWIRIAGTSNQITAIDTQNANGDHSEMTVVENAN